MNKWLIKILICIVIGSGGTGFCWWWTLPETKEKWKTIENPVKIYQGKWYKNYLEVTKNAD